MQDLFNNLVNTAIERVRQFEPEDGYYLAFSGGKDSVVLYEIARRAGVKFEAHYSMTTVDPPELIYFIRQHYPSVIFDHPGTSMWELIAKKGIPPTRQIRYCCDELKEKGGEGRFVLLGVRWAESSRRAKRQMVETCQKKAKRILAPIIDWKDEDVWQFIRTEKLPYCRLYLEGFKRLGCIGCPLAGPEQMMYELERWPKYKENYLRAFARMLAVREAKGKPAVKWHTPEQVMDWWVWLGRREAPVEEQETMGLDN